MQRINSLGEICCSSSHRKLWRKISTGALKRQGWTSLICRAVLLLQSPLFQVRSSVLPRKANLSQCLAEGSGKSCFSCTLLCYWKPNENLNPNLLTLWFLILVCHHSHILPFLITASICVACILSDNILTMVLEMLMMSYEMTTGSLLVQSLLRLHVSCLIWCETQYISDQGV